MSPRLAAVSLCVFWACQVVNAQVLVSPKFKINPDRSDNYPDPRVCPALRDYLNASCTSSKCVLGPPKEARRDVRIAPAPWVELPRDRAQVAALALHANGRFESGGPKAPHPEAVRKALTDGEIRMFHLRLPSPNKRASALSGVDACGWRDLVMQVNYWPDTETGSLVVDDPRLARAGEWRYWAEVFSMNSTLTEMKPCESSSVAELTYVAKNWRASLMVGPTLVGVVGGDMRVPNRSEAASAAAPGPLPSQFVEMKGTDVHACYFDR